MRNSKSKPSVEKVGWLSISTTLILSSLYLGIDCFSYKGLFGTVILNFVVMLLLESVLCQLLNYRMKRKYGIILTVLGIGLLFCQLLKNNLIDRVIVLGIIDGIILLIMMWSLLERATQRETKIVILFVVFGFLMSALYINYCAGSFSPDSYSYYEISQTIGQDYGRVGTIRQYTVRSDYNCSFPYFYPLCIFIVDKITGLGRYAGVLLNIYFMLFTSVLFLNISSRLTSRSLCGGMAIFLLVSTPSYLDEVCAARSIPLALLLSVISWQFFIEIYYFKRREWYLFFGMGLASGLLVSTRFDGVVMLVYFALLVFLFGKNRIINLLRYCVGTFTAAFPWMAYSITRFGKIWISDNAGTAFLVHTSNPTRIVMPGDGTQTLFNAPSEWFISLIYKTYNIILSAGACSLVADLCILVCAILIFFAIKNNIITVKSLKVMGALLIFYIGKTLMFILVGYGDRRYHVETAILVAFALMIFCEREGLRLEKQKVASGFIIVELLLTVFCYRDIGYGTFVHGKKNLLSCIEVPPDWVVKLNDDLNAIIEDRDSELLFLADGYTFGGWTDWKVYASPATSELSRFLYAMQEYMDVEYVIIPSDYANEDFMNYFEMTYEEISLGDYILFWVGEYE